MIVDDHEEMRKSVSRLVRAWGHEVALAADGPSALALADTFQPEGAIVGAVGRRATEPRFPLTGRTDSVTISVTDVVMKRPKQMGDMLPLTPAVFHILLALSDGERHGYALMQEVAADTGGSLQLGPGTLYGCLKRMLSARLVEESDERPDPELDDERRRYYRITTFGAGVLRAEADRLASAVSAARSKRLFSRKNLALAGTRL